MLRSKKITSLAFLLMLQMHPCQAQPVLPFNKENLNSVWALRGKTVPFMFGYTRIFTATLGVEYRFMKRHSVGIDGIYEWFKMQTYTWDAASGTQVRGPFRFVSTYTFHMDYRYYFHTGNRFFPYANAFVKFGTRKYCYESMVPSSYESQTERFGKYGVSAGTLLGFGRLRRFGLDFNAGVMYVCDAVSRIEYVETGTQAVNYNRTRWAGNVRLNFYWYLFRKI